MLVKDEHSKMTTADAVRATLFYWHINSFCVQLCSVEMPQCIVKVRGQWGSVLSFHQERF